jgi:uncharacterized protein YjbI with pentapeptide repeats
MAKTERGEQKERPMSQQQSQTAANTTTRQDKPDTSEPTPERQAELRAAYESDVAAGNPPYAGVRMHTLGEVQWILRERDWSVDLSNSEGKPRPDLREALLLDADVRRVDLSLVNLSRARMRGANFSRALLRGAMLSGTNLSAATLSGADLRDAHLDAATQFACTTVDQDTQLGDVRWNGVSLTRVT